MHCILKNSSRATRYRLPAGAAVTHRAAAGKNNYSSVESKTNRSCREITWPTSDLLRRADASADVAQRKGMSSCMSLSQALSLSHADFVFDLDDF